MFFVDDRYPVTKPPPPPATVKKPAPPPTKIIPKPAQGI